MASPGCIEVTLPEDLWASKFARSAKEGIHAITNIKLVCKTFKRVCERDEVQRQMRLGNVPVYEAPWNGESFHRFYGRLRTVGNTDALFRTGLRYYFVENRKAEGLMMMCQACLGGHDEAILFYGLITVCVGENTVKGYTVLRKLFRVTALQTWEFIFAVRENVLFGPPSLALIAITDKELCGLLDVFEKHKCECHGEDMILAIELLVQWGDIIDQPIRTLCETCFWDSVSAISCCRLLTNSLLDLYAILNTMRRSN